MDYLRDEEAVKYNEWAFMAEQDRVRKVLIGNCRLMDNKLEKNANFEFVAKVSWTLLLYSNANTNAFLERR